MCVIAGHLHPHRDELSVARVGGVVAEHQGAVGGLTEDLMHEAELHLPEAAAANQCRQPYIITAGPTGGVMMHLADQSTPTELRLKGAPGNKTFIGPAEDPPGGQQDREVVGFDGRVLALRWIDTEVQGRYGTMVYVRCGPEGQKPTKSKAGAKPRPKPKAAPKPVQPPIQRQ